MTQPVKNQNKVPSEFEITISKERIRCLVNSLIRNSLGHDGPGHSEDDEFIVLHFKHENGAHKVSYVEVSSEHEITLSRDR